MLADMGPSLLEPSSGALGHLVELGSGDCIDPGELVSGTDAVGGMKSGIL